MISQEELKARIIRDFADEIETAGIFAYRSLALDLLKNSGTGEFNRLDYAETVGFAVMGIAASIAARMRFELLDGNGDSSGGEVDGG